MRKLIVVMLAVLLPSATEGAKQFAKVGTFGGSFLKIGIGARAAALADAYVAIADDASAIYWNPAGIARLTGRTLSVNHLALPADIAFDQAAYVFSPGFFPGVIGFNARALTMDQMERRTVYHPEGDGTYFDAGDMAFGVTYARSLTDKFSTGINLNWIQSGLDEYTAKTQTFDVGTLYDTGFRSIRIGMCIQNIGSELKHFERAARVPTTFRVGMSMNLMRNDVHSLLTSGEFSHPPDNQERASWAMEYSFNDYLYFRSGYKFNYDTEGFAAGTGVRFPTGAQAIAKVDYAYNDWGTLGGTHRVSLELTF
ncbi:MAG: PorV/PorQ family protein [Candidatus Eisenbacteria bacterium]|nr:PorV/PorQ family protein [Candidatus Eisenbacteria bacterium]